LTSFVNNKQDILLLQLNSLESEQDDWLNEEQQLRLRRLDRLGCNIFFSVSLPWMQSIVSLSGSPITSRLREKEALTAKHIAAVKKMISLLQYDELMFRKIIIHGVIPLSRLMILGWNEEHSMLLPDPHSNLPFQTGLYK
jgi:hypothetical protein